MVFFLCTQYNGGILPLDTVEYFPHCTMDLCEFAWITTWQFQVWTYQSEWPFSVKQFCLQMLPSTLYAMHVFLCTCWKFFMVHNGYLPRYTADTFFYAQWTSSSACNDIVLYTQRTYSFVHIRLLPIYTVDISVHSGHLRLYTVGFFLCIQWTSSTVHRAFFLQCTKEFFPRCTQLFLSSVHDGSAFKHREIILTQMRSDPFMRVQWLTCCIYCYSRLWILYRCIVIILRELGLFLWNPALCLAVNEASEKICS